MFERAVAIWVAVLLTFSALLVSDRFVPWATILGNEKWAAWASAVMSAGAIVTAVWAVIHQGRDQVRSAKRVVGVFASELWQCLYAAEVCLNNYFREDELPAILTEIRELIATTSQLRIELLDATRVSAWIALRAYASMAVAELSFIVSNLNTSGFPEQERQRRTKNFVQLRVQLADRLGVLELSGLIPHI